MLSKDVLGRFKLLLYELSELGARILSVALHMPKELYSAYELSVADCRG